MDFGRIGDVRTDFRPVPVRHVGRVLRTSGVAWVALALAADFAMVGHEVRPQRSPMMETGF